MSNDTWTWGLKPPEGTETAWGARAIFKPRGGPVIDLVFNRQQAIGPKQDRQLLGEWLNSKGLPGLTALCKDIAGDSDQVVLFSSDGYVIEGCPRASFGYLYLVAFKPED